MYYLIFIINILEEYMKFSRLSLVAMATLATLSNNAFATDNFEDTFKNGKVAGATFQSSATPFVDDGKTMFKKDM